MICLQEKIQAYKAELMKQRQIESDDSSDSSKQARKKSIKNDRKNTFDNLSFRSTTHNLENCQENDDCDPVEV